ncbi:Leucine-rich repeat, cysteine-containing subtype [Artemisia annua]|uniref:Leucine-rich repeat, cysteine-containing subtype n=1 Tax=Artemisia annua TaxID=35608 RepID=A0A2U1PUC3_ARTAN|nr:Leucine-rich repeat, cysteine-containing subtype [Artemisia annua]
MEQLGDDNLISICYKIDYRGDLKSFSEVSKQFLKAAYIRRWDLEVSFTGLLTDMLPASPNLSSFQCSKPLSNKHIKLLAQSCPKLRTLRLTLEKNLDPKVDYESDFDDDGLCAVANAYSHLDIVSLDRRLRVGDVGVVSILRSSKNITSLCLKGCVKVTDKSLKVIGEATSLKLLNLGACCLITDLGLKYLANGDLKNCLEILLLAKCDRISDAGIIYLGQMVHLTALTLSKCGVNVTDSGISAISKIPNIERLVLSRLINVTNTSLFDIANNCLNLRVLDLSGCQAITSEGLRAFADHPTLSRLFLYGCCHISWGFFMYAKFHSFRMYWP